MVGFYTGQSVMDIEDLVKFGAETKVCPYYYARNNIETADIIVLPYNYIISGETRRAQKVSLAGNIIIFDEAHNIEQSSQESASFDLKPSLIAGCMMNIDNVRFDCSGAPLPMPSEMLDRSFFGTATTTFYKNFARKKIGAVRFLLWYPHSPNSTFNHFCSTGPLLAASNQ